MNGINIVGLNAFFQRKIEGKGFTKAIAKSQAFAKIGTLLALFWAGFYIDAGYAPMSIIVASGLLGIIFSVVLLVFSLKLERSPQILSEEQ